MLPYRVTKPPQVARKTVRGNKAPANCWLRMVGQRILPFILGLDARVRSNIDDEFGVRIIRPENMAKIFRPSEHYVPTSFSALT